MVELETTSHVEGRRSESTLINDNAKMTSPDGSSPANNRFDEIKCSQQGTEIKMENHL
jgi:hypothetical protein